MYENVKEYKRNHKKLKESIISISIKSCTQCNARYLQSLLSEANL